MNERTEETIFERHFSTKTGRPRKVTISRAAPWSDYLEVTRWEGTKRKGVGGMRWWGRNVGTMTRSKAKAISRAKAIARKG
jgi:hypothetical protein